MVRLKILSFIVGLVIVLGMTNASAQVTIEEVNLGDGALGRYRVPAVGPVPRIAFLSIHRTNDYRNHQSSVELANRGFGTLGIRTRFGNSEAAVNFELIALDIRNGVRFLRSKGHTSVILVGRSGGGPSTSYYQALAENGPSYCHGPKKITECPFTDTDFNAADRANGIVFTDAHPGVGVNGLRSVNASVVNENQPFGPAINKTLDPFDPANGYNGLPPDHAPDGDSTYSDHFVDKYSLAQSRRMNNLIKDALAIKRKMELGLHDPADDAFVLNRVNARLVQLTTQVHCCTLNPTKLLQDATGELSAPHIIRTVRVPTPDIKDDDENSPEEFTITSFLSANAIRSHHSLDDLDWCSTNNSTVCAVRVISVPTLVLAHQGHYFIRDGEEIFENAAAINKEFIVVEGATHGGGNCNECAAYHGTGPYVNVLLNTWNYVANWANARF
jgi:hypothetical protein